MTKHRARVLMTVFKQFSKEYPNYGKAAGLTVEDWWGRVTRKVFEGDGLPDEAHAKLYQHFKSADAYELYPDALRALKKLQKMGIPLGVLSNSDSRVRNVLRDFGITPFLGTVPGTTEPNIVLSYDIGRSKPDAALFNFARERMSIADPATCWYVGDDLNKDYHGALAAGWNAILVDEVGVEGNLDDSLEREARRLPPEDSIWFGTRYTVIASTPARGYIRSLSDVVKIFRELKDRFQ